MTAAPLTSPLTVQDDHARRHLRTLEIIGFLRAGAKTEWICQRYEMSKTNVCRIRRMAGVKPNRGFDVEIEARTINLLMEGMAYKDISSALSVSEAYISLKAKENGLERYAHTQQPDPVEF